MPRWLVITRDILLLLVGIFGILHQELTGQANALLLAVYTAILGIPGAASALALIRDHTDTGDSGHSQSPPPESRPESVS